MNLYAGSQVLLMYLYRQLSKAAAPIKDAHTGRRNTRIASHGRLYTYEQTRHTSHTLACVRLQPQECWTWQTKNFQNIMYRVEPEDVAL